MRLRFLLLLVAISILVAADSVTPKPHARARQDASQNVSLGGATFSPTSTTPTGTSRFIVAVSAGAHVPAQGLDGTPIKAVVQVQELNNFNDISHSMTNPNGGITTIQTVTLTGGGRSTNVVFNLTLDSKNTKTGTIAYRGILVRLENNGDLARTAAPTTADAVLTINPPLPTPTPTPTPTPPLTFEACQQQGWFWNHSEGTCTAQPSCQLMPEPCEPGSRWDFAWCQCMPNYGSPVVVDVAGDGFRMTDLAGGVSFDLNGDGLLKEKVAWTAPNSDDAFLFLDRNEDKAVNNGTELFGDVTPQMYSPTPNGFVALSLYDASVHGGNGDGVIDSGDAVYPQLRLWQDRNHNGVSEPSELHTLASLGVASISLDFKESKRQDQFGNLFRYRSRVEPVRRAEAGKWAWDVFLLSQ